MGRDLACAGEKDSGITCAVSDPLCPLTRNLRREEKNRLEVEESEFERGWKERARNICIYLQREREREKPHESSHGKWMTHTHTNAAHPQLRCRK